MDDLGSTNTVPPSHTLGVARWSLNFLSLALRGASETTQLVGQMHGAISPYYQFKRLIKSAPDTGTQHPRTYDWLQATFLNISKQIDGAVGGGDQLALPTSLQRTQSILNGVVGDKLAQWNHPLALNHQLVNEFGESVCLNQLQQRHGRGIVIFVHGLCLNEYEWLSPEHCALTAELAEQGIGCAYWRYNTGLEIHANGDKFNRFLTDNWHCDKNQSLHLVGHSMGGLIIRSAIHDAEHGLESSCINTPNDTSINASNNESSNSSNKPPHWLEDVQHAAYIASPHTGAPLERAGNIVTNLLAITPYSKPLMALGNVRSDGIRSLRHGEIAAPHHTVKTSFNNNLKHLLVAAELGEDDAPHILGDGLVPVQSAFGTDHFPEEHINVERIIIKETGHTRLLSDPRLYAHLRSWFDRNDIELKQTS